MHTSDAKEPDARGMRGGGMWLAGGAAAQQKEILIGSQCDRTGPTQLVGTVFCPGVQDYVNLVNSQGGVDGYKVVINELDNNYQVPPAIEEYERHKQIGMVSTLIWGTPQAEALNPRLEKDHIPGTSPGLRVRRGSEWREVSVSVPACSDVLVAGRCRHQVRQGPTGRQPEGQEDRVSLLRQSGRAGADADPEGAAAERGLRAAHLCGAAARRGNERADTRYRAALSARLRAGASVRPGTIGDAQGPEAVGLSVEQGAWVCLGFVRGGHPCGRRLAGGAGLSHDAVRRRGRRLSR